MHFTSFYIENGIARTIQENSCANFNFCFVFPPFLHRQHCNDFRKIPVQSRTKNKMNTSLEEMNYFLGEKEKAPTYMKELEMVQLLQLTDYCSKHHKVPY